MAIRRSGGLDQIARGRIKAHESAASRARLCVIWLCGDQLSRLDMSVGDVGTTRPNWSVHTRRHSHTRLDPSQSSEPTQAQSLQHTVKTHIHIALRRGERAGG
ncbi:unnamed protein product [Protopolystoma xenopodis]|uniref:Uncharacterized protein n=1 Tax=Protopolystoma xenopodis TaxID=117903 RepID=A0A3S5ADZ0_9PLAT|nr:unnamed protein product [Protopolystoma xenopodis]